MTEDLYFRKKVIEYNLPMSRKALSLRYPFLKPFIMAIKIFLNRIKNNLFYKISHQKSSYLPSIVARHQSVLRRKLGDSNPILQEQKIENLSRACRDLNGLVIHSGETFSLWETLGKPEEKRGYVNGMLLSQGKVIEGVGGGLCQLSNFLCWIFLHTRLELIERHHHSMDVFPDSGRVLPFGSGATCFYNFLDLKFKNTTPYPFQIKIEVTSSYLKGKILSSSSYPYKFSIQERDHCFICYNNTFFRYNKIYKLKKLKGRIVSEQLMFTNFAPVLYPITKKNCENNGYKLIEVH